MPKPKLGLGLSLSCKLGCENAASLYVHLSLIGALILDLAAPETQFNNSMVPCLAYSLSYKAKALLAPPAKRWHDWLEKRGAGTPWLHVNATTAWQAPRMWGFCGCGFFPPPILAAHPFALAGFFLIKWVNNQTSFFPAVTVREVAWHLERLSA